MTNEEYIHQELLHTLRNLKDEEAQTFDTTPNINEYCYIPDDSGYVEYEFNFYEVDKAYFSV